VNTIAVIAKVRLSPEDAPKYVERARALIEPTRAEEGCITYGAGVDICDAECVWIAEEWASRDALSNHLKTRHVQEFLAFTATLDIVELDAKMYDVSGVGPVELPQ